MGLTYLVIHIKIVSTMELRMIKRKNGDDTLAKIINWAVATEKHRIVFFRLNEEGMFQKLEVPLPKSVIGRNPTRGGERKVGTRPSLPPTNTTFSYMFAYLSETQDGDKT